MVVKKVDETVGSMVVVMAVMRVDWKGERKAAETADAMVAKMVDVMVDKWVDALGAETVES